ncbi:DNA cytosine methyltransferase [Candidatus Micrarchaeota archaeon]|nr:DNA cytosine methyltransferase [Candidatus Micrarchaeota archaeon]
MGNLTAVDLFAGAGGASEGLRLAGFRVIAANELNPQAAWTYSSNHSSTPLIQKDIRKLSGSEIKSIAGEVPDLIFAGLPCQGFSTAGRRASNDTRNYLFKEVLRLARELKPPLILIENVTGLLTMDHGFFVESIRRGLKKAGYAVSERVFDAANHGVPQRRKRLFLLGALDAEIDLAEFKVPESDTVTVSEAISDLSFLQQGSSATEYLFPARTQYQRIMRKGQRILHNHLTSHHSSLVKRRFSMVEEGATLRGVDAWAGTKKLYTIRLNGSQPAPTMTTLPDDFIHYSQPRILSVREMARLQSFPDSFRFLGPRTTGGPHRKESCPQYTQVGNAVPPRLMNAVGKAIFTAIG